MKYDFKNKIIYGDEIVEPIPNISFGQYIYQHLLNGGDKIILVDGSNNKYYSCHKLLQEAIILGEILQQLNGKIGDAIGIFSENQIDFPVAAISTLFIGGFVAPINYSYIKDELIHCLSITKPKILFCSLDTFKKLKTVESKLNFLKHIIVFDNFQQFNNNLQLCQVHLYTEIMKQHRNEQLTNFNTFQVCKSCYGDDIAFVFCSSGTTGLPKGVMITNRNLIVNCFVSNKVQPFLFEPDNVNLMFLPIFHAYGCLIAMISLIVNTKLILMNKFDEIQFLELIDRYRVTTLFVVPPTCVFIAKSDLVKQYDLSSVRSMVCGAAPLRKHLELAVIDRFKSLKSVSQGYGMTETTLAVIFTSGNNPRGSVGTVCPGIACKVIDPKTNKQLSANKVGEICFRGDMIMRGYYNNTKATNETIVNGWIHTGDIGYYDNNYNFFILDRIKELIKYKGFQVAPAELEALLLQNEHIKDVGVVGIPDELAGELPAAFVVKQPNSTITAVDIINYIKERVSQQKHLRGGVIFINEIPKTASGKILRRQLKQLAIKKSHL